MSNSTARAGGRLGHDGSLLGVAGDLDVGIGQRTRIVDRYESAFDAVGDHSGQAAGAGGHHGQAQCERIHQRHGQALVAGAEGEDVERAHHAHGVLAVAEELEAITQPELGHGAHASRPRAGP